MDRNAIAQQLRREITSGKYPAGEKLPAYRQLAKRFGAAPNTVGEAVRLLAAEGLVETRKTSPAVVLELPSAQGSAEERSANARDELRDVQSELRDVRDRIGNLEGRVADAITKLNG